MAFVVKDRIKETTTTTGTGTYTLAGAATGGYQTFAEIGTGNTTYYACTDGTDWEVGLGTYTASGTTLSRDQIIESSNSNSAVNWGSGSKDIFVTLPSSKALVMDDNDEFNVNGGDAVRFGADQASSFSRMSLSINGSVGALGMSEPSSGNSTLNLTAQNLRGIGDGGDIHFLGATTGAGSSISLYGGNTKVFETSKTGAGASVTGNLSVSGNLTVNGTTTTVNSTTVTIDDPVFTLGGDTAPTSDDNKDRGIEFRWHDGSAAKVGFFGFDDSEGKLTFIPDATNTSEVFSGSVGTILANVQGNLTGNADTASAADFLTGLADPDADRLLMWDDSASGHAYVTIGSNLSLSGTTLTSTDTTYSAGTGLSLSGTTFTNTAPDQTVSLTGSGATSISGTYPSFTISSTDTTYSAGTGLSLSGTTFTNTAPDQTVALTGSGATSISGTYPNFTISSTDTNTTYSASTGLNLSGTTFSIDTSVVPRLSTDNEFSGSIYLQEDDEFAFYNASNSVIATLTQDATTDLLTLQNHNERVDIKGNNGVRLWHDDTTTDNFGVHVYETSGNVFGALCFNGTEKIVTNGSGVSVVGSLNTTSSATVSGDLTVDSGVLYASSTLNRVGINTTSPTGALEITQTANTSPWGESGIKINNSTGSQFAGIGFRSTFGLYISAGAGSATDNEIRFITSNQGTEGIRMTIDSDGSVGIGTTSPNSRLTLSTGDKIFVPTGEALNFGHTTGSVNTERMRLDASGNLLVGTTSDYGKVTVIEALSGGQISVATSTNNSTTKYGGVTGIHYTSAEERVALINIESNSSDSIARFGGGLSEYNTATQLRFFTAANNTTVTGTERMRINNSGQVGIGTTSPSALLNLSGTGDANTPTLAIDTSTNTTFVHSQQNFAANLGSGSTNIIVVGKEGNTKNSGYLGYYWDSSASNNNFVSIGHWGADHLFRVYGDGTLKAGASNVIFHDGYHPNADKWTTARTLTLSGDASGSVSWDGSANATLSVTVADDSHNHDGRYYTESEADSRFVNVTGDSMTGELNVTHNGGATGSNAPSYTQANIEVQTSSNYVPAISFHRGGYSAGVLYEYDGQIYSKAWVSKGQDGLLLSTGNIGSYAWTSSNDGSGSGLDADLWDGNQFSSYLNQAVLTTSSPTFSSVGVNNAAWIRDITGQYGSIEVDGAATNGYEGYSIGGRAVFMHDNGSWTGIYNDVNNQWIMNGYHNAHTALFYAGSEKTRTLSTGIQVNGTVSIVSDRNLKENIQPIDNSLVKLEQITGYSFDYKDSGGKGHGIIAQELEEIIPDAVQVNDEGYKQVDYNSVIALLINAVKELNEKVQELESNANTYTR